MCEQTFSSIFLSTHKKIYKTIWVRKKHNTNFLLISCFTGSVLRISTLVSPLILHKNSVAKDLGNSEQFIIRLFLGGGLRSFKLDKILEITEKVYLHIVSPSPCLSRSLQKFDYQCTNGDSAPIWHNGSKIPFCSPKASLPLTQC